MSRRRNQAPRRMTDWTGNKEQVDIDSVSPLAHINLWTPVSEQEKVTVTRIRGEIHIHMSEFPLETGDKAFRVYAGIQVVNRAQNIVGNPRSPAVNDDLEGGEWLWLRSWSAAWTVTGAAASPPDWFIPLGGGLLTGANNETVDVKAQRIIDTSQDEVILTLAYEGSGDPVVTVDTYLRLLMKW